jgi:hypothetical protein
MVCCIRQAATGEPPVGRGPTRRVLTARWASCSYCAPVLGIRSPGSACFWASRIRILSFSHRRVEWTEIMAAN